MLPDDTKARHASALEALSQTQVDGHFKIASPDDVKKSAPYSDELFRDAAIQWLVETDQVCLSLTFSFKLTLSDVFVTTADSCFRECIVQGDDCYSCTCNKRSQSSDSGSNTEPHYHKIQGSNERFVRAAECKSQI